MFQLLSHSWAGIYDHDTSTSLKSIPKGSMPNVPWDTHTA